jgi:hypothetical protein
MSAEIKEIINLNLSRLDCIFIGMFVGAFLNFITITIFISLYLYFFNKKVVNIGDGKYISINEFISKFINRGEK